MCYYHITYYYICWYQWLKLSFGFKPMDFWLIYCVVVCRVPAQMVVVQWCSHTQRNYIVGDTCTMCSMKTFEFTANKSI